VSSFPELPDYQILRELGAGGQSQVFLALDSSLKVEVVVKTVLQQRSIDPTATARFLNEARKTAQLKHPNIIEVKRLFEHQGRVYLVMEHVAGMDFTGILRRAPALPPIFVLAVLDQIAGGLEAAHAAGFIHRDIKPANILMSRDGDVKVTDFGLIRSLAADAGDTLTEPTHVVGTPAYMSPQQAQGALLDQRTDMFSLGVLAFEAFAGKRPFGAGDGSGSGDPQEVLRSIVQTPTPPLSFRGPQPPADAGKRIRATVERMLEKDLDRRFQSMGDLRRELRACLKEADVAGALDELGRRRVFGRFATDPEKAAAEFQQQVDSVTRTLAVGARRAREGGRKRPGVRIAAAAAAAVVVASVVWLLIGRGGEESAEQARPAEPGAGGPTVAAGDQVPAGDARTTGGVPAVSPEPAGEAASADRSRDDGTPPASGGVALGSDPAGAMVEARLVGAADWRRLGTAPRTESLAPGSWELRFTLDCHETALRTAEIADGRTASVEAALRPLESAFVRLNVAPFVEGETRYEGEVFLDGQSQGGGGGARVIRFTPCGAHEIEARLPRIFGSERRSIAQGKVAAGDTLDLGTIAFRTGPLKVRSVPASTIEVKIDGRPDPRRAYLPYVREVAVGRHVITLSPPAGRSLAGAEVDYGEGSPRTIVPDAQGRLEVPVEVRSDRECSVVFTLSG
jgi:serine/threonine-protein kinase